MGVGLLPLLLSLVFPACGKVGAQGVAPPGVVDFSQLILPKTPNKSLAAPAGFTPSPDIVTPHYKVSPAALFTVVEQIAAAEPRVFVLDTHPGHLQAAWVARSARANFPDVIEAAVQPGSGGGSELILYSHSIYGQSDFGVNKARLKSWLGAIAAKVAGAQQ